ncbi:kelch-like protein 41 [Physella acuta]|uniref:kelch-like protein 41 n=1 Tax=Physella acuta TaxID=109671 RepID=UPI0027DCE54B|nr:kelch-like protein 41 [Physella acuta]
MSSPPICTEIVKCLESFWSKKQLIDFTVKIDKESIECHRFILAACSDFFQALFNSGMKEVTDNFVTLKDISVAEFELILKAIYTGVDILTLDNFIEVWRAVHQLQIHFMIDLCEKFAIKSISMDKWQSIYKNAHLLNSKPVLTDLHLFMLQNFEKICHDPTFMLLQFDEIHDLIKSQDLVANIEDSVLETVINWVDHDENIDSCDDAFNQASNIEDEVETNDTKENNNGSDLKDEETDTDFMNNECVTRDTNKQDNEVDNTYLSTRKDKLTELLTSVRTCLVSPSVLSRMFKHRLVINNNDAKNIIFTASLYPALDFRHGQWPSSAVHRLCSEYKHCVVYTSDNSNYIYVLDANEEKSYYISNSCLLQRELQFVSFNNELYAVGMQNSNYPNGICRMNVWCEGEWVEVLLLPLIMPVG